MHEMTQRWQCGDVSNYDYLLYLNKYVNIVQLIFPLCINFYKSGISVALYCFAYNYCIVEPGITLCCLLHVAKQVVHLVT